MLSGEGCGVADGIGVTGTAFVSCGRGVVAPCGVVTSSAGVVGSLGWEMGCDGHERFGGRWATFGSGEKYVSAC